MMLYCLAVALLVALSHGQAPVCTSFAKKKQCKQNKWHGKACYWAKLKRGDCLSDGTCHPANSKKKKGKYCVARPATKGPAPTVRPTAPPTDPPTGFPPH